MQCRDTDVEFIGADLGGLPARISISQQTFVDATWTLSADAETDRPSIPPGD